MAEFELKPDQMLDRVLTRWSWIVGAAVVGGLLGLLVSWARPALYEAKASLGIGIDYGRTHSLELNSERSALLQVQALLLSEQVLDDALGQVDPALADRAGIGSVDDLADAVRIERIEGRWDLYVRASAPSAAAELANAWAEAGVAHLRRAVEHALRAQELQTLLYDVGCELQWVPEVEAAVWRCENEAIGRALHADDIPEALAEEIARSHGVLPGVTFAALGQASATQQPIARGRGVLALSGLLAGLVAGLGAAAFVSHRDPRDA